MHGGNGFQVWMEQTESYERNGLLIFTGCFEARLYFITVERKEKKKCFIITNKRAETKRICQNKVLTYHVFTEALALKVYVLYCLFCKQIKRQIVNKKLDENKSLI